MMIEGILSIVPVHGLTLAYLKIAYRAKFYLDDGIPNTDSWSYSGCRIQLYGFAFGLVAYPLLSLFLQRSKISPIPEANILQNSKDS